MVRYLYARKTPSSICQYKEDGLVSRPPTLFTSVRRPMHGTSFPKSQLKLLAWPQNWSFSNHAEMGKYTQNVISSSIQHLISFIFAIHVSFIIPLWMMHILLIKLMQKSVTTVCLHCSFAILKNLHTNTGDNVATLVLSVLIYRIWSMSYQILWHHLTCCYYLFWSCVDDHTRLRLGMLAAGLHGAALQ